MRAVAGRQEEESVGRTWAWIGVGAGLLGLAAGCGTDLGTCDEDALGAPMDASGVATGPYEGQLLVHTSCAGGRCHSASATGLERQGAPAELDFDLVRDGSEGSDEVVQRGEWRVAEYAEEMWSLIKSGEMPPQGQGSLDDDEQEAVRNWLACGAPMAQGSTSATADWTSIFGQLSSCLSCHGPVSGLSIGMGFVMGEAGDPCGAYDSLIDAGPFTPDCVDQGAAPLVQPNMPEASLLLDKLEADPECGTPMPFPGTEPLAVSNPGVVDALRDWIADGAPAPQECR